MRLLLLSLALLVGCKNTGTVLLGAGIGMASTGALTGIVTEAKKPEGASVDHTLTGALIGTGVVMTVIGLLVVEITREDVAPAPEEPR